MKKIYALILCSYISISVSAQCLIIPMALEQRVEQSSLIIEGKVESYRYVLSNNGGNIYTIYRVKPLARLKGALPASDIQVSIQGGSFGDRAETVTNTATLYVGQIAMFTLIASNDPISGQGDLYEPFAGPQGVIDYDMRNGSAKAIFDTYASVTSELRPFVRAITGTFQPVAAIQAEDFFQNGPGGSSFTAAVTGFTPSTVSAGTQTLLTINGTAFGSSRGTSTVEFPNANSGGTTYVTPLTSQYVLWSDNQIQVYVPSGAGTGIFRVVTGSTNNSPTPLTVSFNISNANDGTNRFFPNLINDNTLNGYTWRYSAGFAALTATAVPFWETPRDQWICSSGINWQTGSNAVTDVATFDMVNIVRFDVGGELPINVLGQTGSYYSNCSAGTRYLSEVDMTFDDGTNFYYGTGAAGTFPGQIDFHTVALHELGHAHQIGHIIDNTATMHYSIGSNQARRVLSAGSDQPAAAWTIANTAGTCGQTVMLPLTCASQAVTLSGGSLSIAENGGTTTISATTPARYYRQVTANLARSGTATAGTDYSSGTSVTIDIGLLTNTTTVTSINDAFIEGNETAIFDISSVTNGTENGVQIRTVTIIDDDLVSANLNQIRASAKDCKAMLSYAYLGSAEQSQLIFERSNDELNWIRILSEPAGGTPGEEQSLSRSDNFPAKGINFYRVRRVYASSEAVSNIGRITQACETPISVTPNPAKDLITIQGVSGIYAATIYGADGKAHISLQNVTGNLKVNISSMSAGRYFVKLQLQNGSTETLNFIKQ